MFRRHCTDEQLVAHLDDELSPNARRKVKRHLSACWQCRVRLKELEDQALLLARAAEQDDFPGPGALAEAIEKFDEWARTVVKRWGPPPRLWLLRRKVFSRSLAAAAGVAVVVIGASLWFAPRRSLPPARDVITQVNRFEQTLLRRPVRQEFAVEVAQLTSRPKRSTSRLELWSDTPNGRFASRWTGADGSLKHALWRPDSSREYIYDPAEGQGVARPWRGVAESFSLSDVPAHGLDFEQLERGFMHWLESRRWRPISFTADLARFASQEDVVLEVRRRELAGGERRLVLSAERRTVRVTAEVRIEVDAETFQPRVHRMRFETPEGAAEISLHAIAVESIAPATLAAAVFEPDVPLWRETPVSPPPLAPTPPELPAGPSTADLRNAEIEAHYALHRSGICLGEAVEVLRDESGVVVRGIAQTAERKAELLAALAELEPPVWLKLDVQTIEEAMRQAAERPLTPVAPESGGSSYSLQVTDTELPIQQQLEDYFRARSHGAVAGSVGEFSTKAVALSEAAMQEAWALRRVAQKFPAGDRAGLDARTRWLLEVMIHDHIVALEQRTRTTREHVEPVLREVAPAATAYSGATGGERGNDPIDLFRATDAMHGRILGVLAGADLPVQTEATAEGTRLRMESPEEAVRNLLRIFPDLQRSLHAAIKQEIWKAPAALRADGGRQ